MVIAEPISGFNDAFKEFVRSPLSKVEIEDYHYISSIVNNDNSSILGGATQKTWAVKYTPVANEQVTAIEVFLEKKQSSRIIKVEIQGDSAGEPDGSTLIQGWIYRIRDQETRFRRAKLHGNIVLTASTPYWILLSFSSTTSEIRWMGDNTQGQGRAYRDGVGAWTVESNKTLIFKTEAADFEDNYREIPEMTENSIVHTSIINENGGFTIRNKDSKYSYPQPLREMFDANRRVRIFYGIEISSTVYWLQKCEMVISKSEEKDYFMSVKLIGLIRRALVLNAPKKDYGGQSRREVIIELLFFADILRGGWKLDTGRQLDKGLKLDLDLSKIAEAGNLPVVYVPQDGQSVYDVIEEIREGVGYRFYIDNYGNPVFEPPTKPVVTVVSGVPTVTPDDTVLEKQILSRNIDTIRTDEDVYNRVVAWNGIALDESLRIEEQEEISHEQGELSSGTESIDIVVNFPRSPMINVWFENVRNDTLVQELTRRSGKNDSNGQIRLRVFNRYFGSSNAFYDFRVYGTYVSNTENETYLAEKVFPQSIEEFKEQVAPLITNRSVDSQAQIFDMIDTILNYRAKGLERFKMVIRGYPVYELEDVLKITHNEVDPNTAYKLRELMEAWRETERGYSANYFFEALDIKTGTWRLDQGYDLDKALKLDY